MLAGCFLNLGLTAEPPVSPRPVTAGESSAARRRLTSSLVPDLAGALKVTEKQEFRVETKGLPSFQIEPVRYEAHDPSGGTSFRCGIFIVPESGPASFLPTVGYEWTEAERSDGLDGVGFMDAGVGVPPRILLFARLRRTRR